MLTNVDMVHVQKGNGIAVLVIIHGNTNLVKQKLYVELRRVVVYFVIHDNLWVI